ncbi:MAG: amidase [Candidatus Tectomicrobia bacterium]|uniref:Amidase n=1 Tax=Tectimicrobiota bacterium TaxID=2528274 RepID=A0A933GLG9_UNCTE|nr:amidase [Candidatus Tectomicrobia bacterium]
MVSKDESLALLTLEELAGKIRQREVSPVEVTESVLTRIDRLNTKINAFTTVTEELAREAAKKAEEEVQSGRYRGPLHGIPIGIKDLTDTSGIKTTYGSISFKDHFPQHDATLVQKLKEAGAVIVGKTATHEIGFGVTTNNPFFGPTLNPWNLDHVPGGSSGGSAAAIAANMAIATTGSDGAGSIRIPASFCGVSGVKPTLGLISRFGMMGAGISTFAVEGPICRSVMDCALMLQVLAGCDHRDPFTRPVRVPDYVKLLKEKQNLKGFRVGISKDLMLTDIDPEVQEKYEWAIKVLENLGAIICQVSIPSQKLVLTTNNAVFGAEQGLWHKVRSRKMKLEYSEELVPLMAAAMKVTLDDYLFAQIGRERLRYDYIQAFENVQVILAPCTPITAPRLGEKEVTINNTRYDLLSLIVQYTAASNLVGNPAASVCCGFSKTGLPIGIQVIAPHFQEVQAMSVAEVLEEASGCLDKHPEL